MPVRPTRAPASVGKGGPLQPDVLPQFRSSPPRLVGRADLLASVEAALARGGSVVLTDRSVVLLRRIVPDDTGAGGMDPAGAG